MTYISSFKAITLFIHIFICIQECGEMHAIAAALRSWVLSSYSVGPGYQVQVIGLGNFGPIYHTRYLQPDSLAMLNFQGSHNPAKQTSHLTKARMYASFPFVKM